MVGTRRSARSALFTPTSVRTRAQAKYDYKWLSSGRADSEEGKTYHTSFARIKRSTDTALPSSSESSSSSESESEQRAGSPTPGKKGKGKLEIALTPTDKGKAKAKPPAKKKKGDEARFAIGDGVQVAVEGGKEGVGVLVGLWEEPVPPPSDSESDGGKEDRGTRMMARIHWFFRRQDLPSVMRNLDLEDVSHSQQPEGVSTFATGRGHQWHRSLYDMSNLAARARFTYAASRRFISSANSRTKSSSRPRPRAPSRPTCPSVY